MLQKDEILPTSHSPPFPETSTELACCGKPSKWTRDFPCFDWARTGRHGTSPTVDYPADNLKIGPAHQKMAKHRKKTGRVKTAGAAVNSVYLLFDPLSFCRTKPDDDRPDRPFGRSGRIGWCLVTNNNRFPIACCWTNNREKSCCWWFLISAGHGGPEMHMRYNITFRSVSPRHSGWCSCTSLSGRFCLIRQVCVLPRGERKV
jgi:hypothetical protein